MRAIKVVGPAVGTQLVSDERRVLSRQLLECAKRVDYCGPWVAHRLDSKVIRQQADLANQVLLHCVYPALLGSDVELNAIEEVLAKAALKVCACVTGWVTIGELTVEVEHYKVLPTAWLRRWTNQLGPIALAALTAIPAIPVLIDLLK